MAVAVPAPKTWADGVRVRTTDFNTDIRDAVGFMLDPPQACVYRTTATTLPSQLTGVLVTWEAALYDTNAFWSAGVNPSRVTFGTAGKYVIDAKYQWANYATGYRSMILRSNAAGVNTAGAAVDFDTMNYTVATATNMHLQMHRHFAAGDHIELFVWQNSGATQPTIAGMIGQYLSVRWLAP